VGDIPKIWSWTLLLACPWLLISKVHPNLGLMALGGPQIMEGLPLGPFPYRYIAYISLKVPSLFLGVVSNKCYMLYSISSGAQYVVLKSKIAWTKVRTRLFGSWSWFWLTITAQFAVDSTRRASVLCTCKKECNK
jgi:hypothetical protein